MLPVAKIATGIGLGLLGLVLLVVPAIGATLLVAGVVLLLLGIVQRRRPEWKIRGLIHDATHHPEKADAALEEALAIDSENPEALAAAAQHSFVKADWQQAATYYAKYLVKAPADWQAEAHLAMSYLYGGDPDQAIVHLQKVRALPVLSDDSRVTLTNALASAFLTKRDGGQALEIIKTLPLQRHSLDEQLKQSLHLRAISHYELHQVSEAISDLDRLYALDPDYPTLQQIKDEMRAGTYTISSLRISAEGL